MSGTNVPTPPTDIESADQTHDPIIIVEHPWQPSTTSMTGPEDDPPTPPTVPPNPFPIVQPMQADTLAMVPVVVAQIRELTLRIEQIERRLNQQGDEHA